MEREIIKVTVKLAGQIASDIGATSMILAVEKGAKLQTVLEKVDNLTDGQWREGHIIAVDNEHVIDYKIDIDENSEVLINSQMTGG